MLHLKKGQTNNLVVTVKQQLDLSEPVNYVFRFTHVLSQEVATFINPTVIVNNDRYTDFEFTSAQMDDFTYSGQYDYEIWQADSASADDTAKVKMLEVGIATVYDAIVPEYYTEYISTNENNSNTIYLS